MTDQTRINLRSTPMVHTPGIIAWAKNVFATQPFEMTSLIAESYRLPRRVARGLLDGSIDTVTDGETVSFTLPVDPLPAFTIFARDSQGEAGLAQGIFESGWVHLSEDLREKLYDVSRGKMGEEGSGIIESALRVLRKATDPFCTVGLSDSFFGHWAWAVWPYVGEALEKCPQLEHAGSGFRGFAVSWSGPNDVTLLEVTDEGTRKVWRAEW